MSGDLIQLWDKGVLLQGIWETIYLTFISSFVAYVFGLPIGVLLTVTDKDGIHPIPWLNKIIGILVNIFRSIPFIILMVACLPAAKFIVGTSLGNKAMIVMLVIAAIPYVARMTESSFKEVDKGVVEAAQAMGRLNTQDNIQGAYPRSKARTHGRRSHFTCNHSRLLGNGRNDRRRRTWYDSYLIRLSAFQ